MSASAGPNLREGFAELIQRLADNSLAAVLFQDQVYLVTEGDQRNARTLGSTLSKRLREVQRLFWLDLSGQRRLIGIHDAIEDGGARNRKELLHYLVNLVGVLDTKPLRASGSRPHCEVRSLEFHDIFRVTEEDDLLPFDLGEIVVIHDDDLDRQIVLHRSEHLAHQHRKSTVANKGHHLAIRMSSLRTYRIWETGRHGSKIPGAGVHLVPLEREVTGDPGGVSTAIPCDDGVGRGVFAECMRDNLGLHRHFHAHAFGFNTAIPVLHALPRLFQKGAVTLALK